MPKTDRVAYNDSSLVYFSYAPDKPEYKEMVEELLAMNGLEGARTKAFSDASDAEKYFAIKNIIPEGRSHYENSSFYSSILCDDLRAYYQNDSIRCDMDLRGNYSSILKGTYNLTLRE